MNKQDYLDNLEQYIHEPEKHDFGDEIIPVAMWLRNFIPGDDHFSPYNHSSMWIKTAVADIVDVSINDITRLMILNGYSLGGTATSPEWIMQSIGD